MCPERASPRGRIPRRAVSAAGIGRRKSRRDETYERDAVSEQVGARNAHLIDRNGPLADAIVGVRRRGAMFGMCRVKMVRNLVGNIRAAELRAEDEHPHQPGNQDRTQDDGLPRSEPRSLNSILES
jgi:hypothetical protein